MGGRGGSGTRAMNSVEDIYSKEFKKGFMSDTQIQEIADQVYYGIGDGGKIELTYRETPTSDEDNIVITKRGEDEYVFNLNGDKSTITKDELDEQIDGLFEDGLRVKSFEVVYSSKKAAINAALYNHPAQENGDEVYVMSKDRRYIVTSNPDRYKGWKEVTLE